jgi:hypothetical protein
MSLPAEARSFHTVWIRHGDDRSVSARYTLAGDRLVCMGDNGLSGLADGEHVSATIHAIANGGPVVTFPATIREVAPEAVDTGTLSELLANVMRHDGTVEGAIRWLDDQRRTRRCRWWRACSRTARRRTR